MSSYATGCCRRIGDIKSEGAGKQGKEGGKRSALASLSGGSATVTSVYCLFVFFGGGAWQLGRRGLAGTMPPVASLHPVT